MALSGADLFGVDNSLVLTNYLPQWSVSAATKPGTDVIDQKIQTAASLMHQSLSMGGFDASVITDSDNPKAFAIVKDLVAQRAAIDYAGAVGHNVRPKDFQAKIDYIDEQYERIAAGQPLGELSITAGTNRAVFRHGDDSRVTINERRATREDNL